MVTGFVNALAILIFMAQLPELTNVTWHVYALVALGLGIIYGFPYINKTIPSPLVTIVVLTLITVFLKIDVPTVGDKGALPDTLPIFLFPDIPWNLETLKIILPYSISLAAVGLLESLMTATIVDDLTDTASDKNRECKGQGIANIGAGLMGGMAGCAMIGQSVINIKSGGRGRLSTLVAGVFLLIMVVFLSDLLKVIPMAALVAVMIMVSIGTFSWDSLKKSRAYHFTTNVVLWSTVAVVVVTHNLAYGVLVGVLLSALFFANKVGKFMVVRSVVTDDVNTRDYEVRGQVFFASAEAFIQSFNFREVVDKVRIDLSRAHFWDVTSIGALDKVVMKFRREGVDVEVVGTNKATSTLIDQYGVYDKPDLLAKMGESLH